MADKTAVDRDLTPDEIVINWRMENANELGVSFPAADKFAKGRGDLHRLADMIRAGCEPDLAATILT